MRMLVGGHGSGHPGGMLRDQVVDSLRFLGHEVIVAAATGDPVSDGDRLEAALGRFEPDVLINIPCPTSLDAATVRRLTAATDTVAVCLHRGPGCTAAPTDLDSLQLDLHHYDLVTVPDRATLEAFDSAGEYRLSLLPPAVHVPAFEAVVTTDRRGVVFVGDADPENVDIVATLDSLDDVTVIGDGWEELPLAIIAASRDDVVERGTIYAGAQLMVELPASLRHQSAVRRHHAELGVSDAVLEAAAVGTPAVVMERPAVAELFAPDREVLTYEHLGDLVSMVPLLLASPDELALVGDAAWQAVTTQHTWVQRWDALLSPWVDPHELDEGEDVRRIAADGAPATTSA